MGKFASKELTEEEDRKVLDILDRMIGELDRHMIAEMIGMNYQYLLNCLNRSQPQNNLSLKKFIALMDVTENTEEIFRWLSDRHGYLPPALKPEAIQSENNESLFVESAKLGKEIGEIHGEILARWSDGEIDDEDEKRICKEIDDGLSVLLSLRALVQNLNSH